LPILKRSSLLTVLILLATGLVSARTYLLWKEGPWDLPTAAPSKGLPVPREEKAEAKAPSLVGTETIVSKNLFDPERGESRSREVETNSRAFQRVRSMILLGTAILGDNRYAVLRDEAPTPAPGLPGRTAPPPPSANLMRLKLGDNVEGFRLSEIGDKRVVFTKGPAKVEVVLDYFRKVEPAPSPVRPPVPQQPGVNVPAPGQPGPARPLAPRVLPQLPRRERIPAPQDP
jgi:hypothetical protein